jgi:hypothetical protein
LQNKRALLEAETALATGEIRTPSYCSKWSSISGSSEEGEIEDNKTRCDTSRASSGEQYKISASEGNNEEGSDSTGEDYLEDSVTYSSEELEDSSEELEEEEDDISTSVRTSDSDGSWEPDDKSTTEYSSLPKTSIEVRLMFGMGY